MTDLETRLNDLGEHLALDDDGLVDGVLNRLQPAERTDRTWWLRAAALIAIVASVLVTAVPDTRHAIADWFGFGAVSIQRLPDDVIERADASFTLAGPGDSSIEVVDGREILVSEFDARLSAPLLTKSVGVSTAVTRVDVAGLPGVWIGDGPHEVFYETDDGIGVSRGATRTLLWQADDVIRRVEGFPDLNTALAYATTLG